MIFQYYIIFISSFHSIFQSRLIFMDIHCTRWLKDYLKFIVPLMLVLVHIGVCYRTLLRRLNLTYPGYSMC